jgi:hypothetical protein
VKAAPPLILLNRLEATQKRLEATLEQLEAT